jgi:hypothetical protein
MEMVNISYAMFALEVINNTFEQAAATLAIWHVAFKVDQTVSTVTMLSI